MGTHIKQNRTCHEKLGDADDPSLSSASYGGHLSNLSSTSNSDFVGGVKTGVDIQHTESTCKNNGRNAKSYRDGTRTLTLLVHESQKEVAQKEKEIAELRRKVGILQSRLVNNGLSSVTSSMETDLMIPGVSRRLLDSVIKENCRLKLLLQKKGGMPQKIEELTGRVEELEISLDQKNQQNKLLKNEVETMRSLLRSSSNNKDVEIARLREEMENLSKNKETQDILCESLAEESSVLKHQLKMVSEQCQHLALKLEDRSREHPSGTVTAPIYKNSTTGREKDASEKDGKKEDTSKLKSQLKEVMAMNTRWQSYNEQREQYVIKLQKELADSSKKGPNHLAIQLTENQQKEVDRLLMSAQAKVKIFEEENQQLKDKTDQKDKRIDELEREIAQVFNRGAPPRQDNLDRIAILEAQVATYAEDFENERRDREVAQSRIMELETQIELYKRQVMQWQAAQANQLDLKRQETQQQYRDYGFMQAGKQEMRLTAHGAGHRQHQYLQADIEVDGEDEVDSALTRGEAAMVADSAAREVHEDVLQCPRCKKEYAMNKHNELLEHIDVCCD